MRLQVFVLAAEQGVIQQLGLHVFKAQAIHRVGKPFAGDALFAEQQNGLFYDVQHFFAAGKHRAQVPAMGHFLAPTAANINTVTVDGFFKGAKRTLVQATSAVVAGVVVHGDLPVFHMGHMA